MVAVRGSGQMSTRSDVALGTDEPLPEGTRAGDILVIAAIEFSTVTFGGTTEVLSSYEFGGGDQIPRYSVSVLRILSLPLDGQIHVTAGGEDAGRDVREGAVVWAILTPCRPHSVTMGSEWLEPGLGDIGGFDVDNPTGAAVLLASYSRHTVTNGAPTTPDLYDGIESTSESHSGVTLALWNPANGTLPDLSSVDMEGQNAFAWAYFAYGLLSTSSAPPCRIYPRDDHLAAGSARVFPPPRTQQGGRLNGPY